MHGCIPADGKFFIQLIFHNEKYTVFVIQPQLEEKTLKKWKICGNGGYIYSFLQNSLWKTQ
jgi:hypothetical protein